MELIGTVHLTTTDQATGESVDRRFVRVHDCADAEAFRDRVMQADVPKAQSCEVTFGPIAPPWRKA